MDHSRDNRSAVLSIATYVPENPVSTEGMLQAFGERVSPDLADTLRRLDIVNRYSIVEDFPAYISGNRERALNSSTTELALRAADKCLAQFDHRERPIGLMLVATDTSDRPLPCFGYQLLAELEGRVSRDINVVNMQNQGCSVLPKMFEMAGYYLQANPEKSALIVASEGHTGFLGNRREAYFPGLSELPGRPRAEAKAVEQLLESFLFGDGAVAIALGASDSKASAGAPQVGPFTHLTNHEKSDLDLLTMNEGGVLMPIHGDFPHYHMSKEVPNRGAFYAQNCVSQILAKMSDVLASPELADNFIIHTGSKKILDGVCRSLGVEPGNERVRGCYKILREHANLSACSIGFILEESLKAESRGIGLLVSFGVGFSGSAGVVNYSH